MKKTMYLIISILLTTLTLTSCTTADVVLKYSQESFEEITTTFPDFVEDTTEETHYYNYSIDSKTTLKISHDYDMTGSRDIVVSTSLQEFVDAGLDINNLPEGYSVDDNELIMATDYGKGTQKYTTITDSLFDSVRMERKNLGYHAELDHYGISLSHGKFEFAKDIATNDKDIVFILSAPEFEAVGVDIENIEGWVFAIMKDDKGNDMRLLLKPYSLEN